MLGWSRPWRTRISLHTLSSLPLTFFFAIAFKATSRVTSCDAESAESVGDVEGEAGMCHVARWVELCQGRLTIREDGTHHDFSKRASPEHLFNLIILLLVRRRRLGHNLLRHQRKHFCAAVKDCGEICTL